MKFINANISIKTYISKKIKIQESSGKALILFYQIFALWQNGSECLELLISFAFAKHTTY